MNDETSLQELFGSLRFFVTPPHPCSYLENKEAVTVFLDPNADISMTHYTHLARLGFRRSGEHIYRPQCEDCNLCIPVRIPVDEFKPNRSQLRSQKRNQDLTIKIRDAKFDYAHFELYQRYMKARHPGGGMDSDDPENYQNVIQSEWSDTRLFEFSLKDKLMAVAVVDIFTDGISAVYTFFEPEQSQRSLGVFSILSEIQYAQETGMKWLYLGYWNPESPKMSYKDQYNPIQIFSTNQWQQLNNKSNHDKSSNKNLVKSKP